MRISDWSSDVCSSDLVLIEMIWARHSRPDAYEPKDTLVSLAFGLGSTVAGVLFGGMALAAFIAAYEYRPFDIGCSWWAWRLCFVLDDLANYRVPHYGHRLLQVAQPPSQPPPQTLLPN